MNTHEAIKILRNTAWLGTNEDREKTEQAVEVVAEALEQDLVRCSDCKFDNKCTLQHYWQVDGFTEEIEYCSLGKWSTNGVMENDKTRSNT